MSKCTQLSRRHETSSSEVEKYFSTLSPLTSTEHGLSSSLEPLSDGVTLKSLQEQPLQMSSHANSTKFRDMNLRF